MASPIPAWRKYLKLKNQSPAIPTSSTSKPSSDVAPRQIANSSGAVSAAKRKPSGAPVLDRSAKKARKEDGENKKPKSVSFAAEPSDSPSTTTGSNGHHVTSTKKQVKTQPANKKQAAKPLQQKNNAVNLQPALDYLRKWKASKDDWKFNKNHQSKLLETVFADGTTIPAFDINSFYDYIRGLKGFVRNRLRDTAKEIQKTDMEKGAHGFPDSSKEVAARRQKEYEEIIAGFLRGGRTPEKRRFEEVQYVLRTADMEMQRRVVKRMRAETVMEELDDSDDSSTTTTTTSTGTTSGSQPLNDSSQNTAPEPEQQAVRVDDGSQRRKRRRKMRVGDTQDDDSSSSSESESEESESSSSDKSSEEESDEDTEMVVNPPHEADTSSSSSSSSEESESESDEDEDASDDDEDD